MRAAIRNAVFLFMIAFLFQFSTTYAADQPDTIIINLTNTYIESEQNDIERPIKFTPTEEDTPDIIINIPADFTACSVLQ